VRGHVDRQSKLFSYRVNPEERVPKNHPLRRIKADVEQVLSEMSADFQKFYSHTGRPSVPPETILKAVLLIALYSVRSDRQFCEQLDYNILYRWFLDMSMDEASFDHSCFSKLRRRFEDDQIAKIFFNKVVALANQRGLLSNDHFTVDGTLIEAWASQKSFRPKDDSGDKPDDRGDRNFRGEKRTNDTHASTTDPEAKMMRKGPGKEAKLSYGAHCLMENRNGMIVGMLVTTATDTETSAAEQLIADWRARGGSLSTLGADKGYHTKGFVQHLRDLAIKPHIARIEGRHTPGLDRRTTRHGGYQISQVRRKLVEEVFGWGKVVGGLRKSRFIGRVRTSFATLFVSAAYNLLRMSRLAAA
jgi:transposase